MAVATITKPLDRWDLIADRVLGVPELGWAIAAANPDLLEYLVLPAGITLTVPDLATLRRPLTAANPAREDDGEFLPLVADDTPAPIPTTGGGGVVGDFVPLSAVGVTVAPLFNNLVPIGYLPPYPTLTSLNGLSADVITAALATKLDTTTFIDGLDTKVNVSTYTAGLALKLDASARSAANGVAPLGADSLIPASFLPAYPTLSSLGGLAASARSAANGVAPLGADSLVPASFLPAYPTLSSLGGLAASARNTANGVAGLDGSSFVLAAQIPSTVQFSLRARSGATAIDLNTQNFNHALIRWLDGVAHVNAPPGTTAGALIQYDPLNTISGSTDIYKLQTFFNYGRRVWDRYQSNGNWATWAERAYLDGSQPFTSMQQFSASARFLGGVIPPITTTLTQGGTNAEGLPVYWLVNASATAGNRLKSITISNNGNIRFTHHADDGTAGNVLEHTASGNILTNGTVRPGSGSTAFTGAQFVSGSTYFRTDLLGDSGVGMLTYSDGSVWRRITNGSVISSPDPGIFDLTNNQTAAGNKTLTGKTQFGSQTANFTNASTTAGVGTSGEDAIFSLHCSGIGLGVFGFDFSANRFVIGSNAGKQIDFCTNVGGTPGADNLLNATAVMRIIGSNIVMINLPTSSAGLSAGMVWRNGNVLNVV